MSRRVGPDRVVAVGDRLEIWTPRAVEGWEPRRHRRVAIVVDGVRHAVVEKRREGDAHVHVLAPWTPSPNELVGAEIVYDAAWVLAREEAVARSHARDRTSTLLALLSPFLGLLWSGTKQRLHDRHGLHPARATRRSMELQFVLGAATAFFGMGWWVWWLVFPIDGLLRFHSLLAEDAAPWGFGEWIVGFFRSKRDAGHYPLEAEQRRAAILDEAKRASEASAFVAHLAREANRTPLRVIEGDRVFRDGAAFVVHAATPMEGWEPRKYRKLAIEIEGVRCHVVDAIVDSARRSRGERGVGGVRARYRLEPWPEGFGDLPFAELRYDAALVRAREEEAAARTAVVRAHRALEPFTALVGFLWSTTKARLEIGYGISARRATILSLVIELAVALTLATLHSVSTSGATWPAPAPVLATLVVLFASDAIFRVLVILRGRSEWLGLFEWPFFLARAE